ncbi:MAG: TIGR02300 family protein [Alphaproteobacteria bacterium]
MVKPELGVKRTCPSCGARFYDLLRSPAECPKCEHTFDPEVLLKPRRARPEERKVAAAQVVAQEEEVEEAEEAEEELEEAEEAEEAAVEIETPEVEGEDEEEPAVARKSEKPHEQDGLVEVEEDEEIEDEDEVEIAEIEEEDEDVSDILDADLDKDEG